jgi:hypothetical protein
VKLGWSAAQASNLDSAQPTLQQRGEIRPSTNILRSPTARGEEIAVARGAGAYKSYAAKLRSKDLLIIDDFALAPIPSRGSRELLDL